MLIMGLFHVTPFVAHATPTYSPNRVITSTLDVQVASMKFVSVGNNLNVSMNHLSESIPSDSGTTYWQESLEKLVSYNHM